MDRFSKFVDMAMTPEDRKAQGYPEICAQDGAQPIYPYGLSISLCDRELDKLNMDGKPEAGDMVILHCLAKVTSVTSTDTTQGPKNRVELQITGIAPEGEPEAPRKFGPKSLYGE